MTQELKCSATNADGTPCRSPSSFVDPETGLCPSHSENASERLSEYGRKGAEATAKKLQRDGLEDHELPPLDSPQAAERWIEVVGRAVATGRMSHREGKALARLVREWLRTHEAGAVADRVDDLQEKVAKLKRGDLEVA